MTSINTSNPIGNLSNSNPVTQGVGGGDDQKTPEKQSVDDPKSTQGVGGGDDQKTPDKQ